MRVVLMSAHSGRFSSDQRIRAPGTGFRLDRGVEEITSQPQLNWLIESPRVTELEVPLVLAQGSERMTAKQEGTELLLVCGLSGNRPINDHKRVSRY